MEEENNNNQNQDESESEEVLLDIDDNEEITHDPLKAEQEKSEELFDRLQRLQAEFDNYRKRMDSRILEVRKFASEEILIKFLEIYDNLVRAIDADFETDPISAKHGIIAIQKQFDKTLQKEGVRPIESVGQMFDPYYHHAVYRRDVPEKPDSVILEEYQRGYMLKEKVLRPAVVSVNLHGCEPTKNDDNIENETKSEEKVNNDE